MEITESSTYSTSQIIVDTSSTTVYNNTLRVRGREGGGYRCAVSNSQSVIPVTTRTLTVLCKLFGDVLFTVNYMLKSDSPTPSNLTATYKSPSTVLLEWMFSDPVVGDTMYTVYYQSGGVSYNTSFTLTRDQRLYLMMDLPLEVITNVLIVVKIAVISGVFRLPSPFVGPASLGMLLQLYIATTLATWYHSHSHSGVSGGVAGTSYTLTCTVSLPSGGVVPDSINIQWLGLPAPQIEMTSPGVYIATLDIMLQIPTGYTCTACYIVNRVSSKLVQDRIDIGESMCPLLCSIG